MNNRKKFASAVLGASMMFLPNVTSALDFRHVHLDEHYSINGAGSEFNTLCRDRHDHSETNIPSELFNRVERVVEYFENQGWSDIEVEVLSCFRSPQTNENFRAQGRQVARNSQHTQGNAFDFALMGTLNGVRKNIPPRDIFAVVCAINRAEGHGGAGYYADDEFVHIDVRPDSFADWGGNCP